MAEPTSKSGFKNYYYYYDGAFRGINQNGVIDGQTSVLPRSLYFQGSTSASGFRNPKWKDEIRSGQNATTNFSGTDYSDDPAPYISATADGSEVYTLDPRQTYTFTSHLDGVLPYYAPPSYAQPDVSTITNVTNRCISKFLDQLDNAQSSFEAGQDLGEYKETIEAIHRPLAPLRDKLTQYLSSLKKAKHRYRGNNVALKKVLADTYLEYHFGWQPLADDVAKAIADCGRHRFSSIPIEASASGTYYAQNVHSRISPVGIITALDQNILSTYKYFVRYKGGVRIRNLLPSGQLSWAQSLQLTPDKWLPTAWDLLPYSWISDYFINIGQVIRGFCSLYSSLTWTCKTARAEARSKFSDFSYVPPDPSPYWAWVNLRYSVFGGAAETWVRHVERSIINPSDLVPELQFSVPHTPYAFANLGALLLQRAKPLLPFFI